MDEHDTILGLSKLNKNEDATKLARGISQTYFDDACNKLLDIVKLNQEKANKAKDAASDLHMLAFGSTLAVLLLTVGLGFWLARTITRAIAIPIKTLTDASARIAAGDLRQAQLPVASTDEVGQLTDTFNKMVASIRDMTGQTRTATQNINSATAEILASTKEQAASTAQSRPPRCSRPRPRWK